MTDLRTAAAAALEAITRHLDRGAPGCSWADLEKSLRAALAQTEQQAGPTELEKTREMMKLYSQHCDLMSREALDYQKQIRDMEKQIAQPQQEPARLRRFLIDIRDTGMTAEQMVQHAADALDGQQEHGTVAVPLDLLDRVSASLHRGWDEFNVVGEVDALLKDA
jgi:ATP-dependent exoDNAse (exonuclease V) beta subunit